MPYQHPPVRGFTIIELLTAIAILAILAALAAPSFTTIINNNRLAGSSNDIAAFLQTARAESIRRGFRVFVCPSDNANATNPTCTTGAQWNGWVSFIDLDVDGTLDNNEVLRADRALPPMQVRTSGALSGTGSRVVFRPDGFAYDAAGLLLTANISPCIPTTRPPENVRDVSIVAGTRISVARRNGGNACNAPGNP